MEKIYLAGPCDSERRTMTKHIADRLRAYGYEVYCPFELKIPDAWSYSQEDWAQLVFEKDIEAIDACDIFLMISPGRIGSAGTNWEQGYAYAKGKRIEVLQYTKDPTSLMTYCAATHFADCEEKHLPDWAIMMLQRAEKHIASKICKTVLT